MTAPAVTEMLARTFQAVHERQHGKEPSVARVVLAGDLVSCVLHDVVTDHERSLLRIGMEPEVRDARAVHSELHAAEHAEAIGALLDRPAVGWAIGFDPQENWTIVTLMLAARPRSPSLVVSHDARDAARATAEEARALRAESAQVRRQAQAAGAARRADRPLR